MLAMADRSSSSSRSLNPSAPEFFPNYYMIIHTQTQLLGCVNPFLLPPPPPRHYRYHHQCNLSFNTTSTLVSSANPNSSTSSMYYSPFIHYNNSITRSDPFNQSNPLVSSQNHNQDQLLVSTVAEASPPSDCLAEPQNQVTQLVIEATEEIRAETHQNCYGDRNGNRRRFSSNSNSNRTRSRHAKASFGDSRENRLVLPILPDGKNTTLMIRNIPNKYTRQLLMEFLDNHCMVENEKAKNTDISAFDFLYLPMDFKNKANKGYAFVNFTHPKAAWKFHLAVNRQRWSLFQSGKICEIAAARLQGKGELVRHFQSSCFYCETEDYLPVCFSPPRDGSKSTVKHKIIGRRVQ